MKRDDEAMEVSGLHWAESLVSGLQAVTGAGAAGLALFEGEALWFRASRGLGVAQIPSDLDFCAHVVGTCRPLVVGDARQDRLLRDNPLVVLHPFFRAFAGFPVVSEDGEMLGAVCLLDPRPQAFGDEDLAALMRASFEAAVQLRLERRPGEPPSESTW